nr:MAG TPA: hypothetical protein [Caudoviricetes sp.]
MIRLSPDPARVSAGVTFITSYNYGGKRLWQT